MVIIIIVLLLLLLRWTRIGSAPYNPTSVAHKQQFYVGRPPDAVDQFVKLELFSVDRFPNQSKLWEEVGSLGCFQNTWADKRHPSQNRCRFVRGSVTGIVIPDTPNQIKVNDGNNNVRITQPFHRLI